MSVRSRLDFASRVQEAPEGRTQSRPVKTGVCGHPVTPSVRAWQEVAASSGLNETVVKPDPLRSGAGLLTSSGGYNERVRDRQSVSDFQQEVQEGPDTAQSLSAAAEFGFAAYEAERIRARKIHDRDVASGRLIEL